MIKVKILNPTLGRNEITFRPLLQNKEELKNYSIEITDSDSYDFLFVGMHDFLDKKIPLEQSIEYGLNNLNKITGDYFLFDGSDSTSLMGAYEVFKQSNAIYLFKNQILKEKEMYLEKYAFNKWFFGNGSDLDLSYNIDEDTWNKIKLSNINCGRTIFGTGLYPNKVQWPAIKKNKEVDICAIFQTFHDECRDHGVRNDIPYIKHRKEVWDRLSKVKDKYNTISKKLPFQDYIEKLANSKVCISPFGQGELCFRDFEAMLTGTILIRPDQSNVVTSPNIFVEGETYIGCKLDWSDLEEKIENTLDNFNELNDKFTSNIRNKFNKEYTLENFCLHYYNIFSNLQSISKE
jgi:hypothetical protein